MKGKVNVRIADNPPGIARNESMSDLPCIRQLKDVLLWPRDPNHGSTRVCGPVRSFNRCFQN